MKLSDKLLIAFLGFILMGLLYNNFALKTEYEKQKNVSPDYRYFEKITMKPFHYLVLKLSGKFTPIKTEKEVDELRVNNGEDRRRAIIINQPTYEVWVKDSYKDNNKHSLRDALTFDYRGDTLTISGDAQFAYDEILRIHCPTLRGVYGQNTAYHIEGYKQANLEMKSDGFARAEIEKSTINHLTINGSDLADIVIRQSNQIQNLDLHLKDWGIILADDVAFGSVKTDLSPNSNVHLKGKSKGAFLK
jgi:hypothetical protein